MLDTLDPATPVSAIVLFEVNKAKETEFLTIADRLTLATRRLPGVNVFSFQKAVQEAPTFQYLIYEDWETRDQFRRQWDSEHLQRFQATVGDTIQGAPDLRFYFGWKEYRPLMAGAAPSAAPVAPPVSHPRAGSPSAAYPFDDRYAEVLGSSMHYIEQGTGDPILFLHGNPTWSYIWRNIIPYLSGQGRCIAPDLMGYGRSAKPDIEYTWLDHARYVEAFIQAKKLRNITLVLHDQGSVAGFHYAMRHPENVKGIAFFESIVRPFTWENFSTPPFRNIFRQFKSGGKGGPGWQMIVEQNFFVDELLPQGAGVPLGDVEMARYREPFPDAKSRVPIWTLARETPIGSHQAAEYEAVAKYSRGLQHSRIPKLMLYASPGALLTAEHVKWCMENFPNMKSVNIGDGVHFLQESSPDRIGQEIAAWHQSLACGEAQTSMTAQIAAPVQAASATAQPNYSADSVQSLIDRAAHFNMFAVPKTGGVGAITDSLGRVIGINVNSTLHRFRLECVPPSSAETRRVGKAYRDGPDLCVKDACSKCGSEAGEPLRARNTKGEAAGTLSSRWLFMAPEGIAIPGQAPPPEPVDLANSQRFAMAGETFTFGGGKDGFHGFGTGFTVPATGSGKPPQAMAVGTIIDGFGKFAGLEQGTYVYCGSLAPDMGFMGNILLRVIDPKHKLYTSDPLPEGRWSGAPEPGITYLIFRGQAVPSDSVTPNLGPDGVPIGLVVQQGLRLIEADFTAHRHGEVESRLSIGHLMGRITARVTFDLNAPGGSNTTPVPFTAHDEFTFADAAGKTLGGFVAESSEGRVFKTLLGHGQPVIRFGGIGRILSGSGAFEGITGLMTDNSVVSFTPHVSASVYLLRVNDPDGRFTARMRQ